MISSKKLDKIDHTLLHYNSPDIEFNFILFAAFSIPTESLKF